MKKREKDVYAIVKSCVVIAGTVLCYIVICAIIFCFYRHATPFTPSEEKVDLAQVVIATLSNSVTIAAGLADAVIALVLRANKKEIPKWKITLFAGLFFCLFYLMQLQINIL